MAAATAPLSGACIFYAEIVIPSPRARIGGIE
jgi:hypothetical protein